MYIKELKIKNFRNYENINVSFNKNVNILYGDNAQGKTNLLESIYLLGITKSHREFIDNNLIKEGTKEATIEGTIYKNKIATKLEIIINERKKQLKVDNTEIKKVSDYISNFNIIIFYPEDLEIIKGFPSARRKFLNLEISQIYNSYFKVLADYNRLLKIRNNLLRKENIDINYFETINEYFIDKAVFIYRARKKFVDKINEESTGVYKSLTGESGFRIAYDSNVIDYNDQELRVYIKAKLNEIYQKERKVGVSLFGPHRDDIQFYLNELNLRDYGSQGQQRIAVLTTKLSEIAMFKNSRKETPVLLLDDVFSELDKKKRQRLVKFIKHNVQTIITTTDIKSIDEKILEKAKIIEIKAGTIKKTKEIQNNGK